MEIITSPDEIIIEEKFTSKETNPELIEEFVDEKFKLEQLTPKCNIFYSEVKANFKNALGPVSFIAIFTFAKSRGYSYPATVQWMRMLWRNGKVRRFYRGFWQNALEGNVTGLKYGIHYLFMEKTDV